MWSALKKPLFLIPAETAHHLGVRAMKLWGRMQSHPQEYAWKHPVTSENLFSAINPLGLAAGFDKNCEVLPILPYFGFGFAEIGTVTPKPQGGNDRPRLFRDPENQTLFNRMGFNNLGAGIVSDRLKQARPNLPKKFKVGVNIGKNKLTEDSHAHTDYQKVAQSFSGLADYFVINVSSPNTPGLRLLQTLPFLKPIVESVKEVSGSTPVYIKLAPELDESRLIELVSFLEEQKIDGFVLTNTLAGDYIYRGRTMSGGYSGPILKEQSKAALKVARAKTALPIISVGGVDSVQEGRDRLMAGASAIQIYTSWIYSGPFFPRSFVKI
jgi:dihydroorotate dehydrogenase